MINSDLCQTFEGKPFETTERYPLIARNPIQLHCNLTPLSPVTVYGKHGDSKSKWGFGRSPLICPRYHESKPNFTSSTQISALIPILWAL